MGGGKENNTLEQENGNTEEILHVTNTNTTTKPIMQSIVTKCAITSYLMIRIRNFNTETVAIEQRHRQQHTAMI